jgi:hypothetical protein
VVKWEGHPQDFHQDPKMLFDDLPHVVKEYWETLQPLTQTETKTTTTATATATESKRKRVVTAKAKQAMEQQKNKKTKHDKRGEKNKDKEQEQKQEQEQEQEKEKEKEQNEEDNYKYTNNYSHSLVLEQRLEQQGKMIAELQKQITSQALNCEVGFHKECGKESGSDVVAFNRLTSTQKNEFVASETFSNIRHPISRKIMCCWYKGTLPDRKCSAPDNSKKKDNVTFFRVWCISPSNLYVEVLF